jgi:hypothetical protein
VQSSDLWAALETEVPGEIFVPFDLLKVGLGSGSFSESPELALI